MKLKALLREHSKYSRAPGALSGALGDGYLLAKNPVYRNVRRATLRAGYRFSSKRFHDYDVLALTQLPKILKSKTLPYYDNANALIEVEKRFPNRFLYGDVPAIKANTAFHESAHAWAHEIVKKVLPTRKNTTPREQVLTLLVQEAFANACESFSNFYAKNQTHNEFLYKNSYIMEDDIKRSLIRSSVRILGKRRAFELLFFSFLYANFISTNRALKNSDRVLELIFRERPRERMKLKSADRKTLRNALKIGFDLDQDFTIFTSGFIFQTLGLDRDLSKLLAFDFLTYFEMDPRYCACLGEMSKMIAA